MRLGGSDISAIKIGGTDVSKVYIGTTEVWTAFTGLLDTYTGAAAAYSLRQLSSTSSFAIKIRRSSDNLEQDIGFVDYQLDTSSIASFCSGTDCYVSVWYDQSGNGNDATRGTAANQPKIYDSVGGIVAENGKPSIQFDGYDSSLQTTNNINLGTSSRGIFLVASANSASLSYAFYQLGTGASSGNLWAHTPETAIRVIGNAIFNNSPHVDQKVAYVEFIGSTTDDIDLYLNSSIQTATSSIIETIDTSDAPLLIGSYVNGVLNGEIQELIIYPSDQSSNRTGIETNINANYQIYWDGSQTSLLDTYGGAAAAYSLRALSSSYTGPLIKVRRASDNAEQDIYADYNGSLNTNALESFCSGTDGFVTTWYDQSGNGYDATQTTASYQPQIVTIGSVITKNSKASLKFDGSNDYLRNTSIVSITNLTLISILNSNNISQDASILQISRSGEGHFAQGFGNLGTSDAFGTRSRDSSIISKGKYNVGTNQLFAFQSGQISISNDLYINNEEAIDIVDCRSTISTTDFITIGANGGLNSPCNGNVQEVIIYLSDQSFNRSGISDNINNFYNIY